MFADEAKEKGFVDFIIGEDCDILISNDENYDINNDLSGKIYVDDMLVYGTGANDATKISPAVTFLESVLTLIINPSP